MCAFVEFSDLTGVFNENINIISIHKCKYFDGLMASPFGARSHIPGSNLDKHFSFKNCESLF